MSSVQIRIVIPVLYSEELVEKARHEYNAAAGPGIETSYSWIEHGTRTIESEFDVALVQPDTIRLCRDAALDGADAVVIACFGDPGGAGAKEITSIPIVGEGEAALHVGSLLANRLSIITVKQETVPFMNAMARRIGLGSKLASVRPVDFGVMEFSLSCIDDVVEQSVRAVVDDGAEAIVMGCTGTGVDMVPIVTERLAESVGTYVPVIDPVRAAISLAELCARHDYRPSKRAFPTPAQERPEYNWAAVTA